MDVSLPLLQVVAEVSEEALSRGLAHLQAVEFLYQQALALADELSMRPLQAHCHRSLGTLYAKTAQRGQAREGLSTAPDLYCAMEMTFWLPQVEVALASLR
jgi:hypothetical protein